MISGVFVPEYKKLKELNRKARVELPAHMTGSKACALMMLEISSEKKIGTVLQSSGCHLPNQSPRNL